MKKLLLFSLMTVVLFVSGQNLDQKDCIPVPLPKWTEPLNRSAHDHYLVGYDMNSKTEFLVDTNRYTESDIHRYSPAYIPDGVQISEGIGTLKNFTDLERIYDPNYYPARATVKLFIIFPNTNDIYVGSGIMVSKSVVLTAAHCIYSSDLGGWAKHIWVIPAYDNGNEPFGRVYAMTMYSWKAWTENGNLEWDMGLFSLNCSIGLNTGWVGYGTYNDGFFTSNYFYNFSYPAENPFNGQSMFYCNGFFDNVSKHILYFNRESFGGQSGSGFTYIDANNNFCNYAVLSHGDYNAPTGCTRITSAKFDYIREVIDINQNVPECPRTGLEQISDNNRIGIQIYPNPASEKLNIRLSSTQKSCTLSIYDLLGVKVLENSVGLNHEVSIPVDQLKPGLYLVSVSDGTNVTTRSFVRVNGK